MTTYDELVTGVKNGGTFSINFQTCSVKLNGKEIMRNTHDDFPIILDVGEENYIFEKIEQLYENYKNSMPTKRDQRGYFRPRKADDMTIGEMCRGEDREVARARLEGYVVCVKAIGEFPDFEGWFWQSKNDRDLIILRSWVKDDPMIQWIVKGTDRSGTKTYGKFDNLHDCLKHFNALRCAPCLTNVKLEYEEVHNG